MLLRGGVAGGWFSEDSLSRQIVGVCFLEAAWLIFDGSLRIKDEIDIQKESESEIKTERNRQWDPEREKAGAETQSSDCIG